jgi:hypothetical protein
MSQTVAQVKALAFQDILRLARLGYEVIISKGPRRIDSFQVAIKHEGEFYKYFSGNEEQMYEFLDKLD